MNERAPDPPIGVGIDAVSLDRSFEERLVFDRLVRHPGDLTTECSPHETLAIKEAVIKAIGGRPSGTSLADIEIQHAHTDSCAATLVAVISQLPHDLTARFGRCVLHGAVGTWASECVGADAAGSVYVAWGTVRRHALAAAVFVRSA